MSEANLVEVVLCQAYDDDEADIETAWAESLGNHRYRLKNFPFFHYGISYDDVFEALPRYDDDPRPYLTKVISKSGHKTVRIIFEASVRDSEKSRAILDKLSEMNCGYEGNGAMLFVVNIQPHCDFSAVCAFLSSHDIQWEHADPTYKTDTTSPALSLRQIAANCGKTFPPLWIASPAKSPLDIEGGDGMVSSREIVAAVRESRFARKSR